MSSSYEHRIIRAALRLEKAERDRDERAAGDAIVDLVTTARALRQQRGEEPRAEDYVEGESRVVREEEGP